MINAIVVWYATYMMAALDHLRATGYQVNDSDLSFLSPLLWEHINLHGTYHFDLSAPAKRKGLRPLRTEPSSRLNEEAGLTVDHGSRLIVVDFAEFRTDEDLSVVKRTLARNRPITL